MKGDGAYGNAIVSRFPIRAHASMALPGDHEDPRRALFAELTTPAGSLPFFSTHLSWRGFQAPRREAQVLALDAFVRTHPATLPPIICGDFNTVADSAAIAFLTGRMALDGRGAHYRDAFARKHPRDDGYTWAERNPYVARDSDLDRRIDYILVGPGAPILDARVVMDEPVDGRVGVGSFRRARRDRTRSVIRSFSGGGGCGGVGGGCCGGLGGAGAAWLGALGVECRVPYDTPTMIW